MSESSVTEESVEDGSFTQEEDTSEEEKLTEESQHTEDPELDGFYVLEEDLSEEGELSESLDSEDLARDSSDTQEVNSSEATEDTLELSDGEE